MKFILAQPSIKRFQWELDVLLTNIRSFGEHKVVLLFTRNDASVIEYICNKYSNVEAHVYEDRGDLSYVPSVKPWLWYKYLSEDKSRENDTYFYIDSDVIFREMPDFENLGGDENTWVGSDCGGYIDYDYISSRVRGTEVVEYFATLTNLTKDDIKHTPGAGAQWYITNPTAEFWLKVYNDSNNIWRYFTMLDSDIQKWTAEMWAQLYNTVAFGKKVVISPELDFCRPTDDVKMWDMVKILHNAGVVGESRDFFYKGKYVESTPFQDDLSFVRRDKASIKYVEAINKVT